MKNPIRLLFAALLIIPSTSWAQKFYIADIDKPIYNTIKSRISYLGYFVTDDRKEADFVTELVYEKNKGYMSFKSGYNKVGFIRFINPDGVEIAKTKEQGGIARGYNTYSALSSLFKKIMKEDFDTTIKSVAAMYKPKVQPATIQMSSKADELLKLKKLLDDGVLTQEEFESQKKKLLEQ